MLVLILSRIMMYICSCKQGEKIDCYIPYCTTIYGVQGGSDATLFFFYVTEVPERGTAIYQPPRNYRLS